MKIYHVFIVLILIVIIITAVFYFGLSQNILIGQNNSTTGDLYNSNSSTIHQIHSNSTTDIDNSDNCSDVLQPINGDLVFNNINWSLYPGVDRICIHDCGISEPTSVIKHTFPFISIDVNVKDPENTRELYREMAGVAVEIRQMVGPNSSISVVGIVNGYLSYSVDMLPYDNRIYASDHYHPLAYKNEILIIPGDDIYDHHSYTIINNSVIEP